MTGACGAEAGAQVIVRPAVMRGIAAAIALALREIFRARAHAAQLVLWADPVEPGPVLKAIGRPTSWDGRAVSAQEIGVPVTALGAAELERLFRAHSDGWAAFFRAYPGSPGLVEVTVVAAARDGRSAALLVGRSCGEHCRQA